MSELKPVNIAILALGGEGGDVLAAWLADAAERGGYLVQTTSESGIAERTGAAMYYLALFPKALAAPCGKAPVLGLTPMPGHVDIVVATELMEAGRAIERGLVTPDRTALIASTHRVYTMAEKTAQSDSRADPFALLAACRSAAAAFVGFDMASAAEKASCPAIAVILGAVAASGTLPIPLALFEEAIREAGQSGLQPRRVCCRSCRRKEERQAPAAPQTPQQPKPRLPASLFEEVENRACGGARPLILAGLERTADYQDSRLCHALLAAVASVRHSGEHLRRR